MYRTAPCLFLCLCLSLPTSSAPAPTPEVKKSPAVEEIKKAIEELGSNRFAVRDKAKKFLADAGAAAEPLLEEAAKNPDEEIASAAKAILEKYQWGLYPDTPKDLRDLIEKFRSGAPDQRQQLIGQLLKLNPLPFPAIRKLIAKEEDADVREQIFATLSQQARKAIPDLLRRNDYDAVEGLFELTLTSSPSFSAPDYALFVHLRGKLDSAIARFEKERVKKGDMGPRAAEALVYLYRIKGDWAAARKAAEDSKKSELVERVLWQSDNWKELAKLGNNAEFGNSSGLRAAYDRLAGNTKDFDEKIAEIKKSAEESMEDRVGLRQDADALFLNSKANDAITILIDKKTELALTFDLLCAQMKHKEAFALVDEARRRDTDPMERNQIEVRRARMLYVLGEKDAAIQLFQKVSGEIRGVDDFLLAKNLIKAEARAGLKDLAAEHAAKSIDLLVKAGQLEEFDALLEPIFGDDKDVALMWWKLVRRELANDDPALAMKLVRDILSGKLDRKKLDEWLVKMAKEQQPIGKSDEIPIGRRNVSHDLWMPSVAVAAVYRALKDDAKTEEFLKKAALVNNLHERWLAHGDFLYEKKKYKDAAESYRKAAQHTQRSLLYREIDGLGDYNPEPMSPALPTYLQGRAALMSGDKKEGERLIELAHWLPLGNEIVRGKLVDELYKRDWPEMARKEADLLLKSGWYSHYSYGNVLSYLARQAAKEKDYSLSADYYEKCLIGCLRTGASFVEPTAYLLVPESVRVYRARAMLTKGRIEEALKEANANLEVMPGNIDLAIKLVPELEKLGKKKEADAIYDKVRGAYEKLAKEYPGSAFARNSTAWVMANCRRDLDAALKHSQKAVELEPKNAGYMDTLAEVHFRKGERDKALSIMKECSEMDPKNAYFRKQLARFKDQPFDSPTPDEGEEDA